MKYVYGITAVFLSIFLVPWVLNISKLIDCDFKPSYRCEIIHSVGVFIPPAAVITIWFDTDIK
jgi:hypothetical protein